jgi:S1-C subfamily serine protease
LDVNLYPSQAGAAVVSATGRFIGMATTAILRHSALAVPMGTLHSIAHEMLSEGGLQQGYLGVGLQPVSIPEHLRRKSPLAGESGLMIVSIEPGTSAEQAGLQLGDILLAAGSESLTRVEFLMATLRGKAIGKPVLFSFLRAGEPASLEIEIAPRAERKN